MVKTEDLSVLGKKLTEHSRRALEDNGGVHMMLASNFYVTANHNVFIVTIEQVAANFVED